MLTLLCKKAFQFLRVSDGGGQKRRQEWRYWKGGRNGGTGKEAGMEAGKEAGMEVLERRQEWRYWKGGRNGGTGM
jgi:hypothetical protein